VEEWLGESGVEGGWAVVNEGKDLIRKWELSNDWGVILLVVFD
jgi:hypothetical protein